MLDLLILSTNTKCETFEVLEASTKLSQRLETLTPRRRRSKTRPNEDERDTPPTCSITNTRRARTLVRENFNQAHARTHANKHQTEPFGEKRLGTGVLQSTETTCLLYHWRRGRRLSSRGASCVNRRAVTLVFDALSEAKTNRGAGEDMVPSGRLRPVN